MDAAQISQLVDGGTMNSTDETSLTVSAAVHLVRRAEKLPSGMVAAYGTVLIGDWAVLNDLNQPLKHVKITFVVPSDLSENSNTCVILTVPSTFLPLSTRSSVCVPYFLNKTVAHVASLSAIGTNGSAPGCRAGAVLKLIYNGESEEDFYLSKGEKWSVYLHLVHFSYFLYAIAVGLICFSLLRTRAYIPVVTNDKIPLGL